MSHVALLAAVLVSLVIGVGFVLAGLSTPAASVQGHEGGPGQQPSGPGDGDVVSHLSRDRADTDGDGLSDEAERDLGTDPTVSDTDGDGFPDGMEVACTERLPAADPLRQDVYVEVDTTAEATLSADVRSRLQYAFATAPVENPIADSGIALHFVDSDSDLPQADVVGNREGAGAYDDIGDYREKHFDNASAGYYYLLVVSNASYQGDPSYAGAGFNGTALVEEHDDTETMATLVMHELGHAFGIGHDWRGVDTDAYSVTEYRSVMNYNGLYEVLDYAEGEGDLGRDEWAFVGTDRYVSPLDCPAGGCDPACS